MRVLTGVRSTAAWKKIVDPDQLAPDDLDLQFSKEDIILVQQDNG